MQVCAFRRGRRASDACQLEIDEYIKDLRQYSHLWTKYTLWVGHPEWDITTTQSYLEGSEMNFLIHIKALTAVEVKHIANLSDISVRKTLEILKASGLGSLKAVEQKYWMVIFEK